MRTMTSRMTRTTIALLAAALALQWTGTSPAQTTQPATPSPQKMTLRDLSEKSAIAFEASDYATALPLLKELAVRLRNEPAKVAPVLEQIRVCEANIASTVVIEGINAPRVPHVKPADGARYDVELQKLGNFAYDPDARVIPDDVRALEGVKVRMKGFMQLISESESITRFQLVPDRFACCFGQPPQIQHTAMVVCPPGKSVRYFPEEVWVEGMLKVGEKSEEGFVLAIFEITATSIRPVEN